MSGLAGKDRQRQLRECGEQIEACKRRAKSLAGQIIAELNTGDHESIAAIDIDALRGLLGTLEERKAEMRMLIDTRRELVS